jgi:hypothetical protein
MAKKTNKISKFCYICKAHIIAENSKEGFKRDFYGSGHVDEKTDKLFRDLGKKRPRTYL